jgi:large subunit ribosomal protein L24
MARHVRKGDSVVVTAGNDRGKVGEILRVIPAEDRIIVQEVNIRVRHLKPTQQNPKGGLLRKEMPIHISNVSPVVDGRGTRVRFEKREDGSKVRLAVRGGKELSVLRGPKQG